MFKKMLSLATLILWLVLLVNGAAVMAQDVCVTNAMANLATPTTVTELRQYLEDIRQVLSECDPVSEGAIEVEILRDWDYDLVERDANGCYAAVVYGPRLDGPIVQATVEGKGHRSTFIELKEPGASTYAASEIEFRTFDNSDVPYASHNWGERFMSTGRYEVRYEAFIGADPVTLAFEVEYNAWHRIQILCS